VVNRQKRLVDEEEQHRRVIQTLTLMFSEKVRRFHKLAQLPACCPTTCFQMARAGADAGLHTYSLEVSVFGHRVMLHVTVCSLCRY
jgi:hypothetical protein